MSRQVGLYRLNQVLVFSFFINSGPGPVAAGQDWPHKGGSEVSKRVVQPLLASWPLVSLAGQW